MIVPRTDSKSLLHRRETASTEMYCSSGGSRFVFEARPTNEPEDDDMEVYVWRFICTRMLYKRFVIIFEGI